MKRILIAEDEKAIARSLQLKLESDGYRVDIVVDGRSAMQHLTTESYDLLILDLMLPQLDGFGVLKEMDEKGITTPVCVASNLSQQQDKDRVNKHRQVKEFFVKSNISIKDVVDRITSIIGTP